MKDNFYERFHDQHEDVFSNPRFHNAANVVPRMQPSAVEIPFLQNDIGRDVEESSNPDDHQSFREDEDIFSHLEFRDSANGLRKRNRLTTGDLGGEERYLDFEPEEESAEQVIGTETIACSRLLGLDAIVTRYNRLDPANELEVKDPVIAQAETPNSKIEIFQSSTPSGLSYFHGTHSPESQNEVLESIARQHDLVWLVNAQAAGLPYDSELFPKAADLLADFPADVRGKNSLHVFTHAVAIEQLPEALSSALETDAAIGFSLNDSAAEFGDNLKLMIGWFTTAASLKFQLENGTGFLIENLFLRIKFILLPDKSQSGRWLLFNNPTEPVGWKELGFLEKPIQQ